MPTYNYYYELPVYKICRAFRKKVSAIAKRYFPKQEEYHLKAQVLNSSRSVTAYDEKYITKDVLSEINKDYKISLKEINGFIKYLKKAKQGAQNN